MTDFTASGFAFELFAHVTRFFGLKVVLLGLYNGQKLEKEPKEDITMYTRAQEAGACRSRSLQQVEGSCFSIRD